MNTLFLSSLSIAHLLHYCKQFFVIADGKSLFHALDGGFSGQVVQIRATVSRAVLTRLATSLCRGLRFITALLSPSMI